MEAEEEVAMAMEAREAREATKSVDKAMEIAYRTTKADIYTGIAKAIVCT